MKWCMSFFSSSHKKSPLCCLSTASLRSTVYLPVRVNSVGFVGRVGISARGSPVILHTILNCARSAPIISFTFFTTGLYFLPYIGYLGLFSVAEVSFVSLEVRGLEGFSGEYVKMELLARFEAHISSVQNSRINAGGVR